MITVNAHTRLSELFREHPAALETIIGISPRFQRLRNPVLRKLMAGRTTLVMASRIGGCAVEDFFSRLGALGFVIERGADEQGEEAADDPGDEEGAGRLGDQDQRSTGVAGVPAIILHMAPVAIEELDVRPLLEGGTDPLRIIMAKVNALAPGKVLKIVNSFEPSPLIKLLAKKGYDAWTEIIREGLVHTYFYRREVTVTGVSGMSGVSGGAASEAAFGANDWARIAERFAGKQVVLDVRSLEMPQPMLKILAAVDQLPEDMVLLVHHRRIPVFLLPELIERGLTYCIRETGANRVDLLIYKDGPA